MRIHDLLHPATGVQVQQKLLDVPQLQRHDRLAGSKRKAFRFVAARAYEDGSSVRAISERCMRSASFVRTILHEAGVTLRPPGSGSRGRDNHRRHAARK
ncbi:helix-turn-helix domain-containing protein [Streptomyces lydicus]|uniref:helix-turn-helix domain-containing protein n=1 Tax=Streptomyces lydicus TaxID=47763 RepID=UPI0034476BE9